MNIFIGLQKNTYSKPELHLTSLRGEFQNLVADTWKVLAPSDSLLYFWQIKFKNPYLLTGWKKVFPFPFL